MNPPKSDISTLLPNPFTSEAAGEESQVGPAPDVLEMASRPWFTPAHEDIQNAAYQMYLQSGHQDGQSLDHWLAAEQALRNHGNESLDHIPDGGNGAGSQIRHDQS